MRTMIVIFNLHMIKTKLDFPILPGALHDMVWPGEFLVQDTNFVRRLLQAWQQDGGKKGVSLRVWDPLMSELGSDVLGPEESLPLCIASPEGKVRANKRIKAPKADLCRRETFFFVSYISCWTFVAILKCGFSVILLAQAFCPETWSVVLQKDAVRQATSPKSQKDWLVRCWYQFSLFDSFSLRKGIFELLFVPSVEELRTRKLRRMRADELKQAKSERENFHSPLSWQTFRPKQ